MFLLILVLACSGTWALDPEAIPEHPVTTIPVESDGILNVFYDRSGLISVETNNSTTGVADSTSNGIALSGLTGQTSASTEITTSRTAGFPTTSVTTISTTTRFPTTSEATISTTKSTITSSSTTTTNKPDITSPTTYGAAAITKNPNLTSPSTNASISSHEASIFYNSGSKSVVYGFTNGSSNLGSISSDTGVLFNTTDTYNKNYMSDFYLPTSALGNLMPENSSEFSNHTKISSDSLFIGNSSMHDKASSSRDWNSTSPTNFTNISHNSKPALISNNNIQSNISGINSTANIKVENGTIDMSSVYSFTNIPIVNNPINITDVFNPVNISEVFFPINITNIYSPINISGIYSPVNIINVYSPVKITNVRSPVKISNVFSPITISDVYSPVNISNVHSSVNASNVYSLISIDDYSRKPNISERFDAINSSRPENSNNNTDIYNHNNITGVYDIERIIDALNISDILKIFGLEISDLYGSTNTSLGRNITNMDNDHPDLYSTTEPNSYFTTDWTYAYYTTITSTNSTIITNPANVTAISQTNDTSLNFTTSRPTKVSFTISTSNFTNTTQDASNSIDIDSFLYFDYPDNGTNTSGKNDTKINITSITTEAISSTYYTTEPATTSSTTEQVNITEPYTPVNFTGEQDLGNSSSSHNPDNITIENRTNVSDTQDNDNGTKKDLGPTCSGGDILKHIFLTYRLSPPETRAPRVYVIPVPVTVQVPVPVQVYNPSYYIPLEPYNALSRGNSFYDYFPYYSGSSQPQWVSSSSMGWDPTSSYYSTYGSMPQLVSSTGHFDPLGYQGGLQDPNKYQHNTLNSQYDSSMYPSRDLDKKFSPYGPAEDTAFEPDPYFLMDISEGAPFSLTDPIPQGPISYQTDYGNKDPVAYSPINNPKGFTASYSTNYQSVDSDFSPQGSVSYSKDINPQGYKSYQELDSFYKGLQSEDLKPFSDYVVPQDTQSYLDYNSGLDKTFYKTSSHRGEKWHFLEMKAPKERTLDWTRYFRNNKLSRRSPHSKMHNSKFEPPVMSKFNQRPQVIDMRAL